MHPAWDGLVAVWQSSPSRMHSWHLAAKWPAVPPFTLLHRVRPAVNRQPAAGNGTVGCRHVVYKCRCRRCCPTGSGWCRSRWTRGFSSTRWAKGPTAACLPASFSQPGAPSEEALSSSWNSVPAPGHRAVRPMARPESCMHKASRAHRALPRLPGRLAFSTLFCRPSHLTGQPTK